ncbi:hypothetical protein Hanom_Chr12g01099391 [Helianthus anomalus]
MCQKLIIPLKPSVPTIQPNFTTISCTKTFPFQDFCPQKSTYERSSHNSDYVTRISNPHNHSVLN